MNKKIFRNINLVRRKLYIQKGFTKTTLLKLNSCISILEIANHKTFLLKGRLALKYSTN